MAIWTVLTSNRCGPFLALVLAVLTTGCASFPRTPAHPYDDPRFKEIVTAQRPGVPDDSPPALVLLPGDQVTLETVSTTTSSVAITVDSQGALHVPLAGDVEVGGMTLGAAENKVKAAMQRYDKYVHVNLRVAALAGHNVTVLGAVPTPGVINLPPGARLSDVLLMAGGEQVTLINAQMVSGSDMRNATLVRNGKEVPVDFVRALEGDPTHNVYMRAGDHVHVPPQQGENIYVLGIMGGVVFQFAPGMRLTEALARAGGVPVSGDKNDIRVIRGPLEAPRVYQSSLRDIVDGETHDVELFPGDIIWVEDHWIEDFGEVMAVLGPLFSSTFSVTALVIALQR